MSTLALTRLLILMTGLFFLSFAQTLSAHANAAEEIDVNVENRPAVSIQGVGISADHHETTVYGRVRRLGVYFNPFSGARVIAQAVYPDGSIREQIDTFLTRSPRPQSFRKIYPAAKFKIVFPERLPPGTTVLLSFRSWSDGETT